MVDRSRRWPYLIATALAVIAWRLLMLLAYSFDRSELVSFPGPSTLVLPTALLLIGMTLGWRRGWDWTTTFGMIAVIVVTLAVGDTLEGSPGDDLAWAPLAALLFLVPILIGLLIGANLRSARAGGAQQTEIPEFRRYAQRATAGIASPRERADAADELYQHALSHYDDIVDGGQDHQSAVTTTLQDLGDPAAVITELGRAHRQPLTPSAIALLVTAVLAFVVFLAGLYALLFAMEANVGLLLLWLAALLITGIAVLAVLQRRKQH